MRDDYSRGRGHHRGARGQNVPLLLRGRRARFLQEYPQDPTRSGYDLIIVGGGPAGLTAAVYAATLHLHTFVAMAELGGQAIDSTKVRNYRGYDFITGPELVETFRDQLLHSKCVDHRICSVDRLEQVTDGFCVTTSAPRSHTTRAVILATGMARRRLNLPGEEEFQRRGVFYGNVQDASFAQGAPVAVVGGGNSAMQIVETLLPGAREIHVISDIALTADPSVLAGVAGSPLVVKHEGFAVSEIRSDDTVSEIVSRELSEPGQEAIPVRGVFIAIGLQPDAALVADLAELSDRGEISIAPDCATSVAGLFAAGDVTDAYGKRIIIAAGEGAKAVLAAKEYLIGRT